MPIVAVNLWYHVGAANEEPGRTGFAHLFEHMMFTGSKHIRRGLAEELLAAAGVSDSNASTSFDRTNYFDTVPSNQLELALWTHADRMGYLLDSLDQTALTNQQDVVRNERRQTTENRPYGIVDEARFHALFPPGHPYRPEIIGSHVDIQAARLPMCAISSSATTARTTPRWSSVATSKRPPPSAWSKSSSARSDAAPKFRRPPSRRHP